MVSSCHAADVPSVSDFVPNPMNHAHFNGFTDSAFCACFSSHLAGRGGAKTLFITYPHTEKSRGVKSGNYGGQALVPSCPIHDDWQDF